jgi:hypothetical protein
MPSDNPEAQVALFSPYLGGVPRQQQLREALRVLGDGALDGQRPVQGGRPHRFHLSWQPSRAPLEPVACELVFPDQDAVGYRFTVACHELVGWLMEWQEAEEPRDLPQRFWHWLLIGAA